MQDRGEAILERPAPGDVGAPLERGGAWEPVIAEGYRERGYDLIAQGLSGFNAEGVYDFSGIDSVDMFTGNLSLHIPIGQRYQSNGSPVACSSGSA